MATPPHKRLPDRPSEENLKKQAKRRAKSDEIRLSAAQRDLARQYGFPSWPKLISHVRTLAHATDTPGKNVAENPICTAAAAADSTALKTLLAEGASADVYDVTGATPLILACRAKASPEDRLATVTLLIEAGAPTRAFDKNSATALHFAAWHGPMELAETLIRAGAKEWQADKCGRKPVNYARDGVAPDKERIIELLDRPVMRDPAFRAAVRAIQTGDLPALKRLLNDHPNLVRDRAVEPDCYPADYFRDPRLLWFVANNPNLIKSMPANTVEIAEAIFDAGPARSDVQYTLGLVMTSSPARAQGFQRPLIRLLLARGAEIDDPWFLGSLGHGERDAVRAVLETGVPVTAPAAAGLGRLDDLRRLLPAATDKEKHAALSMAVINRELEAARLCLEAGADVNAFAAMHQHSTPLHQATVNGDVPMMKLLIEFGAGLEIRDTLWGGTPLGWAIHTNQPEAEALLRSLSET